MIQQPINADNANFYQWNEGIAYQGVTEWSLIQEWVDVHSKRGQYLLRRPEPTAAVFDPADHPELDMRLWNQQKDKANCYGYSVQAVGEVVHPGLAVKLKHREYSKLREVFRKAATQYYNNPTPHMFEDFKKTVRMGLKLDNAQPVESPLALYKPGHSLIALFFNNPFKGAPQIDFHFMRLDSNAHWSMVCYENYDVHICDDADELIKNPARAKFKHTLDFGGFYHVPRGGVQTIRQALDLRNG